MKYPQLRDEDRVYPLHRGWKFICCDCGLVHMFKFRVRRGRLSFTVHLAKRETAAARRRKSLPFIKKK